MKFKNENAKIKPSSLALATLAKSWLSKPSRDFGFTGGIAFYFFVLMAFACSTNSWVFARVTSNYPTAVVTIIFGCGSSIGGLIYLFRTRNGPASGVFAAAGACLTMMSQMAFTGYGYSPIIPWFFTLVVGIFLLCPLKASLIYSTILAAFLGLAPWFAVPLSRILKELFAIEISHLSHSDGTKGLSASIPGWHFGFDFGSRTYLIYASITGIFAFTTLVILIFIFQKQVRMSAEAAEKARAIAEARSKDILAIAASDRKVISFFFNDQGMILYPSKYFQDMCSSIDKIGEFLDFLDDDAARQRTHSFIVTTFGGGSLDWECNSGLLPMELTIGGAHHRLSWFPLFNEAGELSRVYVEAECDDDRREAETVKLATEQRIALIGTLATAGANKSQVFINRAIELLHTILEAVKNQDETRARVNLHTLKGDAKTMGFTELGTLCHGAESASIMQQETQDNSNTFDQWMQQVGTSLKLIETTADELGYLKTPGNLGKSAAESRLGFDRQAAEQALHSGSAENYLSKLLYKNFKALIDDFRQSLESLAVQLGKIPVQITVATPEVYLTQAAESALRDALVHVLRNSIDHGIENPDERLAKGKLPFGTISVIARLTTGGLEIKLSDDGAGFQLARIRDLALQFGVLSDAMAKSDDLLNCLFMLGFSTAKSVTEVSGRGVGMHAAKLRINDIGGKIHMAAQETSDPHIVNGTIHIILPSSAYSTLTSGVKQDTALAG